MAILGLGLVLLKQVGTQCLKRNVLNIFSKYRLVLLKQTGAQYLKLVLHISACTAEADWDARSAKHILKISACTLEADWHAISANHILNIF